MVAEPMVASQAKETVLSVAEVASELGVARITVRRWLKARVIEGFQLPGGHYRIPASEVHRIQATKERQAEK
jgi:excisionase family DNA binding protein